MALERQQCADEFDVGRHLAERFRLEEQLLEALSLDGVLLDDGHDVLAEVAANVAEPFRQAGGRAAQAGAAWAGVVCAAVDLAECFVEIGLVAIEKIGTAGELAKPVVGGLAEDHAPAREAISGHAAVVDGQGRMVKGGW